MSTRRRLAAVALALALAACGDTASQLDGPTGSDAGAATPDLVGMVLADLAGADLAGLDLAAASDLAATDAAPAPPDSAAPPPLFDLPAIRDPATAACAFDGKRTALKDGVLLDVWNASYTSWESVGGALRPIRIRGYLARPQGGARLPGVVLAHGLGGYAQESSVVGLAASLGTVVIGYTGPGGGGMDPASVSEGLPSAHDNGKRMFDTLPDARGSWFWGHAVAAMRAATCLAARPDVDASKLGMTGFSAGGVATLMASSVDDRLRAAVPLSGTGAWDIATRSPGAWQHALLTQAGYTTQSPEWLRLFDTIDARHLAPSSKASVLMVNGSTDEFFPLSAHMATFDALASPEKRLSFAGNFDHGCYKLTGGEPAGTIEARAELHAGGGQRAWFHHVFGTDARYAYIPKPPTIDVQSANGFTVIAAVVDPGGARLRVDEVRAWMSGDDAFFFASAPLDAKGNGLYGKQLLLAVPPNAVWYVDVTYRTDDLVFPQRFAISSPPRLPAGHVPRIRDIKSCQ